MSLALASNYRRQAEINFLKGTLNPRAYKFPPPNFYDQTTFTQTLEVTGNWTSVDPATLLGEKVLTSYGIVLWLINRGAASLYRMGFIPINTITPSTTKGLVGAAGTPSASDIGDSLWAQGVTYPYWNGLKYTAALVVPYNNNVPGDTISISPPLTINFSRVRVYSAEVSMIGDTVSIGSVYLNGVLALAAIADTTDIAQVLTSGNYSAYDPTLMVQVAVSEKDALKEINAALGVTAIIGSDIAQEFLPPDADAEDYIEAVYAQTPIVTGNGGFSISGTPALPFKYMLYNAWVTPWQTMMQTVNTAFVTAAQVTQLVQATPIEETGCFDIKAHGLLQITALPTAGATDPFLIKFEATAEHLFITTSSTGNVYYTILRDTKLIGDFTQSAAGLVPNPVSYSVEFSPSDRRLGFLISGKYVGTHVTVGASLLSTPGALTGTFTCTHTNAVISVRARAINKPGNTGPARVFIYQNLGVNQVLKMEGVINAQCVPQGAIAPFTKSKAMYSQTAVALQTMPLCAQLYNGPSLFRRCWVTPIYKKFCEMADASNPDRLASQAYEIQDTPQIAQIEAAGLFESLGGKIGHGLGELASGGLSRLGSLADKALPFGLGASGQFNLASASGQFALRRQRGE